MSFPETIVPVTTFPVLSRKTGWVWMPISGEKINRLIELAARMIRVTTTAALNQRVTTWIEGLLIESVDLVRSLSDLFLNFCMKYCQKKCSSL